MIKEQFAEILNKTQSNQTAQWTVDIDGTAYTRIFRPKERLILLGGGHIAQPLCSIAAMLGFGVTVVDDRPSFANHPRFPEAEQIVCDAFPHAIQALEIHEGDYLAVITRGHRYDADCLRTLLSGTMPKYLGLLGSRRRTIALLNLLEQEGFERKKLDAIHTPTGYRRPFRTGNCSFHCGSVGTMPPTGLKPQIQVLYSDRGNLFPGGCGRYCGTGNSQSTVVGI